MFSHLDDYYCFAMVVEHGGFSAAERATDIPKSKLSRRIQKLEEYLNIRLIHRNSRQFSVTDMGMQVYERAKVMIEAAKSAEDLVQNLSDTPRGTLKLSLPTSMAQNEFTKILPEFLNRYPEVRLQLVISNRRVDLINEGIDLAVRVRTQLDEDSNLIIRRFGISEQHLCASQAYLNQYGTPNTPEELESHRILSMSDQFIQQSIELKCTDGSLEKVQIQPVLLGSDLIMLAELAAKDCGIALLPDSVTTDKIASGELVYVLPDYHAQHGIFHMVYPSRKGILPAVRVLIDFLAEKLTEECEIGLT